MIFVNSFAEKTLLNFLIIERQILVVCGRLPYGKVGGRVIRHLTVTVLPVLREQYILPQPN